MMIAVARAVVAARKVKEVRQDHAGFRPQYLAPAETAWDWVSRF